MSVAVTSVSNDERARPPTILKTESATDTNFRIAILKKTLKGCCYFTRNMYFKTML